MRCLFAVSSWFVICTARVIDCLHRPQWRHQQILYSTEPYSRGIWEKESIIGVHWFPKNPSPLVHRSVGNSASLVSHWNGGPSGWDFSVPTEHQWWILFISHTPYHPMGKTKIEQLHVKRQVTSFYDNMLWRISALCCQTVILGTDFFLPSSYSWHIFL